MSAFRDASALEVQAHRLRIEHDELAALVAGLDERVRRARQGASGAENHDAFLRRQREEFEELRQAVVELSAILEECERDLADVGDRLSATAATLRQRAREERRRRLGR